MGGYDFNNEDDFRRLIEMDEDERQEFINEGLADLAEVWMGDTVDDILARSMIGAMRSMLEAAHKFKPDEANPHVAGVWFHAYRRLTSDFQTLAAITAIKKSLGEKG
jgi:hypothetical protein